jgi:hypothetical protein
MKFNPNLTNAQQFIEENKILIDEGTLETILDAYSEWLLEMEIHMPNNGRERF